MTVFRFKGIWCKMFFVEMLKRAWEVIMAKLASFQEYAEKKEALEQVEALLKECADAEPVVGGNDHLSKLIEEYSLVEEQDLSKEDLISTVAGVLDPGDRIWKQILEKNGGELP